MKFPFLKMLHNKKFTNFCFPVFCYTNNCVECMVFISVSCPERRAVDRSVDGPEGISRGRREPMEV